MRYVRNAWYVAAWSQDVCGEPSAVTILAEPLVLFRDATGKIVVLEDRCVHRLAPLSLGRCEGDRLRCMYHGLLFDAEGAVVEIPGQAKIPAGAKVRAYPSSEHAGWVWVWMGNPDQCSTDLLPAAVGPDSDQFLLACGQLDYDAEAKLIHENLLDFSHLTYVHANSFGTTDDWAKNKMKTTLLERGVRFERWVIGSTGPKHAGANDDIVDGYICYDFVLPGVLLMWSGMFAQGTAERVGFGKPDYSEVLFGVTSSAQAVVPTMPGKARYFFNTGPLSLPGNEAIRDQMLAVTKMAFEEDRLMIEGQQKIIDLDPDRRMMPIEHDKGVTMYNNLAALFMNKEG